jgi:NCAIR mutase (PurE)-related protein
VDIQSLRALLADVHTGKTDVESALERVKELPLADLGYATVDHHRALRQGVPEVIFGQGKAADHVVGIARELVKRGENVLVTRLDEAKAEQVKRHIPEMSYSATARVGTLEVSPPPRRACLPVALVCAGTADLPVAEECAETLRAFGIPFERVFDVGVAGLHRLWAKRDVFERSCLTIVVAGMEGALPSVVGGLVSIPVIAVPTSVGYGAGASGFAALAGMLTSCASGVTVCNIDNGFGAAFAAHRMIGAGSKLHVQGEG